MSEHTVQLSEVKDDKGGESSSLWKRWLAVVNVYCPMVDVDRGIDLDRLEYKLKFYSALQERCTALEKAGK